MDPCYTLGTFMALTNQMWAFSSYPPPCWSMVLTLRRYNDSSEPNVAASMGVLREDTIRMCSKQQYSQRFSLRKEKVFAYIWKINRSLIWIIGYIQIMKVTILWGYLLTYYTTLCKFWVGTLCLPMHCKFLLDRNNTMISKSTQNSLNKDNIFLL